MKKYAMKPPLRRWRARAVLGIGEHTLSSQSMTVSSTGIQLTWNVVFFFIPVADIVDYVPVQKVIVNAQVDHAVTP